MALDRPVALVGLSGSGKSTVGPLLATALDTTHIDLDRAIEAIAEASVAQIFAESGEDGFRQLELKALQWALADHGGPPVVSTGGGIVTTASARELLKEKSHVVWLDAPVEELAARLSDPVVTDEPRPLLGDQVSENALRRLSDERQGWYAEVADQRVNVASATPDEVVVEILEKLR